MPRLDLTQFVIEFLTRFAIGSIFSVVIATLFLSGFTIVTIEVVPALFLSLFACISLYFGNYISNLTGKKITKPLSIFGLLILMIGSFLLPIFLNATTLAGLYQMNFISDVLFLSIFMFFISYIIEKIRVQPKTSVKN